MSRRTTQTRPRRSRHAATLIQPRADVFAAPPRERHLPVHGRSVARGALPAWLFVAAHGGSGAGLLARMSWQPYEQSVSAGGPADHRPEYGIDAGTAWPDPRLEPTPYAVIVCRTTMAGLARARDAAAQYLSGHAPPGLRLLGLVTVADQPGHDPRPIAAARGLLTGAYPKAWHIPYVPEYRLLTGLSGEPNPLIHPAIEDVLAGIRTSVTPKGRQP